MYNPWSTVIHRLAFASPVSQTRLHVALCTFNLEHIVQSSQPSRSTPSLHTSQSQLCGIPNRKVRYFESCRYAVRTVPLNRVEVNYSLTITYVRMPAIPEMGGSAQQVSKEVKSFTSGFIVCQEELRRVPMDIPLVHPELWNFPSEVNARSIRFLLDYVLNAKKDNNSQKSYGSCCKTWRHLREKYDGNVVIKRQYLHYLFFRSYFTSYVCNRKMTSDHWKSARPVFKIMAYCCLKLTPCDLFCK